MNSARWTRKWEAQLSVRLQGLSFWTALSEHVWNVSKNVFNLTSRIHHVVCKWTAKFWGWQSEWLFLRDLKCCCRFITVILANARATHCMSLAVASCCLLLDFCQSKENFKTTHPQRKAFAYSFSTLLLIFEWNCPCCYIPASFFNSRHRWQNLLALWIWSVVFQRSQSGLFFHWLETQGECFNLHSEENCWESTKILDEDKMLSTGSSTRRMSQIVALKA